MRIPPLLIPFFHLSAGAAVCVLTGCGSRGKDAGAGRREGKVPVLAAQVERKAVPVALKTFGNVLPRTTVTVKPKVTGEIAQVHFKEGQELEKGDLLFSIDARPYEVALTKADADLEKAKAVAVDAELRSKNFSNLDRTSGGSVSKDEVNRFLASAATARADVLSAEAAVKSAKLQTDYCAIRAPQAGRTGAVLVDAGNVVTANTTDLVVINAVSPVEVSFPVAGQYLGDVARYMKEKPLEVTAVPEGQPNQKAKGTVVFIDNQVNRASGTIELRALFPNTARTLWPGQFVDVELILTTETDRVTVPSRAVQAGQEGSFVFVIKDDLTAAVQAVKVARVAENGTVIAEGLKGGERVVIDGQAQLAEGSKVEIKTSLDEAAGGKPAPEKEKPAEGSPAITTGTP